MIRASFIACLCFCAATAFGWESEPEFVIEGVLHRAERTCITRYPEGTEETKVEKSIVLVTNEPVVLSRSIALGSNQVAVQKESLSCLNVNLDEEFISLIGKRVKLYGSFTKPFDFFFRNEIEFEANTALDSEWTQTHQPTIVSYEPELVQLTGKLYEKEYPGPPEYTSVEEGDLSEVVLILALTKPIEVRNATRAEDDWNAPKKAC